ncbi:MAG: NAD(P)/FAD-dependent oxidoreductase [Microbacteriaceae bacterium]
MGVQPATVHDVIVVGAGPAGLSAALNLVRARRSTLVFDANRPRNAATLHSHGFLTRDGMSPLELRRLGREELERYPNAVVVQARVESIRREDDGTFTVASVDIRSQGIRGEGGRVDRARAVLIATGLSEAMPAVPSLRGYYGTHLHSCLECDGFEKSDERLVLIGETDDLARRAFELRQWSQNLVVLTNAVGTVTEAEEADLATLGIRVDRRKIDDIEGERATMTGVRFIDGGVVTCTGGFVRPIWSATLAYAEELGLERDESGLVHVDARGRTSVAGVYAAGDSTAPGPQQLIVAAGEGAHAAAVINRDLLGTLADAATAARS